MAKGFHQRKEVDFREMFSPVAKPTAIRIVFSFAIQVDRVIRQLNVNNGFLNGDLKEEVNIQQPQGFMDSQHLDYVCHLYKSLYSLKEAPQTQFERLTTNLSLLALKLLLWI